MIDTRQNLLDEIEIEKERRLWILGGYSTSELWEEIKSREDKNNNLYEHKDTIDFDVDENGNMVAFNTERESERATL